MSTKIKTGDRVEIGFKGVENEGRRKLSTVVEAVLNSRDVLILMPMSAGNMVKLPMAMKYEARFYTADSSVMVYDVSITEHPLIDGIQLTKLCLESAGEKIQTRDFYRINKALEFNFSLVSEQAEAGENGLKLYKGVTKDMSGGGMSFVTDLDIEEAAEIYANFVLEGEYIVVLGKVRGQQQAKNSLYSYLYRCQFLAMPDAEQEKIIQYINNQQYRAISQTRTAEEARGN